MKYKEFLEYLENSLEGYHTFIRKARQYQDSKNAKRPAKSRWSDEKIEKATYEMWKKSMESLYNKLKAEIKSDSRFAWTDFMEKNNIFEVMNDSISEMDFSDDAA